MAGEKFEIIAKTLYGLESVLADEIEAIGGTDIFRAKRAVRYIGDLEILYKSNFHLRTALRVLKPIATFRIFNDHQLHRKVKRIAWETIFTADDTFAIDAVTFSPIFRNSKYIALKTKDAIADRFRETRGRRPSVDIKDPTVRIHVHISDKECTVSLDSSGHSLDKRGYKTEQTEASMSEVLAAGLVKLSGWEAKTPFINPMCGAGTIAIEAAMIAEDVPPGKGQRFGFERWQDFDLSVWRSVKMYEQEPADPSIEVFAFDTDTAALDVARSNARRAGVSNRIQFKRDDLLESRGLESGETVIINPPYGERLQKNDDMEQLYSDMGRRLKHYYPGAKAFIISSNVDAMKQFGLRPDSKVKLFNGKLACSYQGYSLYHGSRKST
jgi:putative N6-adenine-specific DNA methylase